MEFNSDRILNEINRLEKRKETIDIQMDGLRIEKELLNNKIDQLIKEITSTYFQNKKRETNEKQI